MSWDAMPWIVCHSTRGVRLELLRRKGIYVRDLPNCARCKRVIDVDPEYCWYCSADLCHNCKDMAGHCGHPEAEKIMRVVDGR